MSAQTIAEQIETLITLDAETQEAEEQMESAFHRVERWIVGIADEGGWGTDLPGPYHIDCGLLLCGGEPAEARGMARHIRDGWLTELAEQIRSRRDSARETAETLQAALPQ